MTSREIFSIHGNQLRLLYDAYKRDEGGRGREEMYNANRLRAWLKGQGRKEALRMKALLKSPMINQLRYQMTAYTIGEMIDDIQTTERDGYVRDLGFVSSFEDLIVQMTMALLDLDNLALMVGSDDTKTQNYVVAISMVRSTNFEVFNATRGKWDGEILPIHNKGNIQLISPDHGMKFCGANAIMEGMTNIKRVPKDWKQRIKDFDKPWKAEEVEDLIVRARDLKLLNAKTNVCLLGKRLDGKYVTQQIGGRVNAWKATTLILLFDGHVYIGENVVKRAFEYEKYTCERCKRELALARKTLHDKACLVESTWETKNFAIDVDYSTVDISLDPTQWNKEYDAIYRQMKHFLIIENKCVLVRGPAGSGKSRGVHTLIQEHRDKHIQPLAPTAKVAQDLGGRTLHSFFKLPAIQKRSSKFWHHEATQQDIAKIWDLTDVDILVFDEFSMISSKTIDLLDHLLRLYTGVDKLMGGIPTAFFGDEAQLPPIDHASRGYYHLFPCSKVWNELVHGGHFQCEITHPRRLEIGCRTVNGDLNLPELQYQFNLLQQIRVGITSQELLVMMERQRVHSDDIEEFLFNTTFLHSDDIIMVNTNDQLAYLMDKIATHKALQCVGKNDKVNLQLEVGMKMLITDNQAVNIQNSDGSYKYPNGTLVEVHSWKEEEYIKVRVVRDGNLIVIQRGSGFDVSETDFPLMPYKIQTVHRMQGTTHTGKVYWFYNDGNRSAISNTRMECGQSYVMMSRTTNMKNIHILCTRASNMEAILKPRIRAFNLICQIQKNVKSIIPIYSKTQGKDSSFGLTTTDDMAFAQYDRVDMATRDGEIHDRNGVENSKLLFNTIFQDWETNFRTTRWCTKLYGALNTPRYFFKGVCCDLVELAISFGYQGYIPNYLYDGENRFMIFNFQTSDDPGKEYGKFITSLCEWKSEQIEIFANQKKKRHHYHNDWKQQDKYDFIHHTLYECTYNGGGFDCFFTLQHLCKNKQLNPLIIRGGGNNLKTFAIQDQNGQILFEMYDVMAATGVGSLSAKLSSHVVPNMGNYAKFLPWEMMLKDTGTFPDGECLSPNWHELDEKMQLNLVESAFKRKRCGFIKRDEWVDITAKNEHQFTRAAKEFKRRCQRMWKELEFYKNLIQNPIKGCVPLFYYSQYGWEKRNEECIDLLEYMTVDGKIHWERAFFDREIPMAKEMHASNPTHFKQYALTKEVEKYARQDVDCMIMLALAWNNSVYGGYQRFRGSQMKHSWGGIRASCLRFPTAASLSHHNGFCNYPLEVYHESKNKKTLEINVPLMPSSLLKQFNQVEGGRTQARRGHYISTDGGVTDFLVVLDESGMYMKVMEELEFPCGSWQYFDTEKNPKQIQTLQHRINTRDWTLEHESLFVIGYVKEDDHETESNWACKLKEKGTNYRSNAWHPGVFFSFQVPMLYDNQCQFKVSAYTKWEKKVALCGQTMKEYDNLKRTAEENDDVAGRAIAKEIANSFFGRVLRGAMNDLCLFAENENELANIIQEYGHVSKPRVTPLPAGGYLVDVKTDEGLANVMVPQGRSILAKSKMHIHKVLKIALGDNRRSTSRKVLNQYVLGDGDTDSVYLPKSAIENLHKYDEDKEECDKIIYQAGSNKYLKAGRYTLEHADDIKKIAKGSRGKYLASDPTFPNTKRHYCPRIIRQYSKAPKTRAIMMIVPPKGYTVDTFPEPTGKELELWNQLSPEEKKNFDEDKDESLMTELEKKICRGWRVYWSCKLKGVRKNSTLELNDEIHGHYGPLPFGNTQECFELMEISYEWDIPFRAVSSGTILRKYTHPTEPDKKRGIEPFDIESIEDPGKKIWSGEPKIGRQFVLKKEYKDEDPKILRMLPRTEIYESFTVPFDYPLEDLED